MAKPDAPRNDDEHTDPQDDTTFATTGRTTDRTTDAADPTDDTTQLEQTVHSDTTERLDTTEQLGTTDETRSIGVEEQSTSRDLFGNPVHADEGPTSAVAAGSTASVGEQHTAAPLPERPTGPHAPAIVLGLVCLAVAGIILAQELGDLTVDWGDIGPFGIIVTGAVLVLFGLVGLLTSRRTKTS